MRLITAVMRFSILFGSIIAFLLSFILIIVYHIHLDLSIYFQDAFRNIIARESLYYLGSRAFCVAVYFLFMFQYLGISSPQAISHLCPLRATQFMQLFRRLHISCKLYMILPIRAGTLHSFVILITSLLNIHNLLTDGG